MFCKRAHREENTVSWEHLIHVGARRPRVSEHQVADALGSAGGVGDRGLRSGKVADECESLASEAIGDGLEVEHVGL